MRQVFADTFYWTALLNPRDEWHQRVKAYSVNNLGFVYLVTTSRA
jgi:hypothetical protein